VSVLLSQHPETGLYFEGLLDPFTGRSEIEEVRVFHAQQAALLLLRQSAPANHLPVQKSAVVTLQVYLQHSQQLR
jgi:hypothetical protein